MTPGRIHGGPLAQLVEQRTFNPWVVGSSPTGPTFFFVLLRVMLDTFSMVKAISAMEQRYQAVLAVIADGRGVGGVAAILGGKCIDTSMGFTPPRGA